MRDDKALKIIGEISTLKYQPGDILVVKISYELEGEEAEQIYSTLESLFGKDVPILIIGEGIELSAVRDREISE